MPRKPRKPTALTVRETPEEVIRDIQTRSFTVRSATINEQERSIDAVLATDAPVTVLDRRSWETIDEVLRMDGCEIPAQLPMLESHSRWSLDDVLGSIRSIRLEDGQVCGRLFFATDERSERAWQKVRGGHLTDVSVGYASNKFVDIAAKQSGVVNGRTYTAGERTLRITTAWTPREASLVPIGADPRAKIREEANPTTTSRGVLNVNPQLRAYLVSIGLRSDATDEQAQAFLAGLNSTQRAAAETAGQATPPATVTPPAPEAQRSAPPAAPVTPPVTPPAAIDENSVRTAERARIRQLEQLARSDVAPELLRQAIDEGWDVGRASTAFLSAIQGARAPSAGSDGGFAIHSRNHESDCTIEALGAGLAARSGLDLSRQPGRYVDCGTITTEEGRRARDYRYTPYRSDAQRQAAANLMEQGDRYRSMSMADICREACRIQYGRSPMSSDECIRTALSGSTLSAIFTTNVNAQLLQGYMDASDTTDGWVSDADVANFLSQERATMGKFGNLAKHKKGGTAENLDTDDSVESYKIARYSGIFSVDEMDLTNDRFGAIEQTSPQDMGMSARQLRPNLVYAILLANAALGADSIALFEAGTHKNTGAGALGTAGSLTACIAAMRKQRIKKRPLNLQPRYLIVPQDLAFTAEILLSSAERSTTTADLGNYNPLRGKLDIRADDRVGVAGVTDPNTGTAYAGTASNYFLACRPGENGAKTIEVGYLRGTGRAPQIRAFVMSEGQWGIGWDVKFDIGAKALDFRGMYKCTG
jgi:hypothetical protein